MGCNCGKPKCDGKCGISPAVLQINNPSECVIFHKVDVPASMGDSTTNPPKTGAYKNVLLYYEADQTSWLYSSDGIPVRLTNGITNYEGAINLPQINGETLIGDKTGEELGLQDKLTAGDNISIEGDEISAVDTTYGPATDSQIGLVKPGDGLSVSSDGTLTVIDHVFDTVADMKASTGLKNGDYAQTLGYHTKGDGGGAYYSISDTSQTGAIALANDLYAIFTPVSNLVYSVESFAGSTPEEKLFNALDTITEGVILAGKVEITHQYTALAKDYRKITILGASIKLNTQMWFVQANATAKTVPAFKNCSIEGANNKFFDDSTVCVGMLFEGCNIKATIMYYGNYYVQSPYFLNCTFESQGRLLYTPQIFDFKMIGCRVESASETLVEVTNQGIMQGSVDDCLIEGRTNVVFKFTACFSFSIAHCYFEANNGGIVNQTGANSACYLNFKDNWVSGSMTNTNYAITIASSAYGNARISNNISNIDTGKYICSRVYGPLGYIRNENINYAHPWKGSGFVPRGGNRWDTINGSNKTATWDADNSAWVCTYQLPYAEAYTELHPIYLYFAGSYSSSATYQGFAIVRVDLSTVYTGGAIKAYGETTIIAGRNHGGIGTPHDITATVTLSNDAYNTDDILVTVKLTGFTSNRGKYRFLDPFTILGIDQEK